MKSSEIKEGLIGAFYTKNGYFLKIKPAYGIGKVKWSFVKLNTKGQGFDIYMDIDEMDNLADDVLSYRLKRAIEEERAAKAEYPRCFEYITGDKGTKCICIGHGNFGVRIQGTIDKKTYANVPCSYNDLKTCMKWFKRTSEKYFSDCTDDILEAAEKYYKEHPVPNDVKQESEPAPAPELPDEECRIYQFHAVGELEDTDENYQISVSIDGFNQNGLLIFPKKDTEKLNWIQKMKKGTNLRAEAERTGGRFTFLALPEK